jgi:hypothetical protein
VAYWESSAGLFDDHVANQVKCSLPIACNSRSPLMPRAGTINRHTPVDFGVQFRGFESSRIFDQSLRPARPAHFDR